MTKLISNLGTRRQMVNGEPDPVVDIDDFIGVLAPLLKIRDFEALNQLYNISSKTL
jgi:hypothetical protein